MTVLKFDFTNFETSLFWGIASGGLSCISNLLLIEAMAHEEAGICATVFRLNMALSALMAFAFLGEQLTILRLLAVGLALGAVLLFAKAAGNGKAFRRKIHFGLFLAALASLMRSGMAVCYASC